MLYSKAPITEASIDIWFTVTDNISLARLETFQESIGDDYNERQDISLQEFLFQPNATEYQATQTGYRFINTHNRCIIQARRDGFTFSRLAPYDKWETFSQEARTVWGKFRDHIQPETITCLGVRYINRLDLPSPIIELKEYLATLPEIGPSMPQMLQGYFMQLVLPMEKITATAIINQGLVPPLIPGTTSILLDIGLSRDTTISQEEQAIWKAFEELREGKNQIFDAMLTEKTKELIR